MRRPSYYSHCSLFQRFLEWSLGYRGFDPHHPTPITPKSQKTLIEVPWVDVDNLSPGVKSYGQAGARVCVLPLTIEVLVSDQIYSPVLQFSCMFFGLWVQTCFNINQCNIPLQCNVHHEMFINVPWNTFCDSKRVSVSGGVPSASRSWDARPSFPFGLRTFTSHSEKSKTKTRMGKAVPVLPKRSVLRMLAVNHRPSTSKRIRPVNYCGLWVSLVDLDSPYSPYLSKDLVSPTITSQFSSSISHLVAGWIRERSDLHMQLQLLKEELLKERQKAHESCLAARSARIWEESKD